MSEQVPHTPSIIVNSGGGLHCYWLLREPEPVDTPERMERVETIMRGIAARIGGDIQNIASILRIPGTFNNKIPNNPRPCSIIQIDTNARYNLADFDFLAAAPKPVSHDGGRKPGAFNVRELSPQVNDIIRTGKVEPYPSRSERDQAVCCALVNTGRGDAEIFEIFSNNAVGDKFREKGRAGNGYLKTGIAKARATSGKPNIDRDKLLSALCELSEQLQIYRLAGREGQILHPVVNETIIKGIKSKWLTASYLQKATGISRSDSHKIISGLVKKRVLLLHVVGKNTYNKRNSYHINLNFSEWR